MKKKLRALRVAVPYTIPVFTGFTILGTAYGILMNSKGYGVKWTVLASVMVFTGSAQYVAITFLTSVFDPINAFLMTVMINARHLFYGISMLDKYKNIGRLKPYLIFGLCDETFSIVCSSEPPEDVDKKWFNFFVTFLNHCYWVLGSLIGALLGPVVSFNTKGLDFVLTALFVSTFVGQWKNKKDHRQAIVGVVCSIVGLIIFGPTGFIIPSMIAIIIILIMMGRKEINIKNIKEEKI